MDALAFKPGGGGGHSPWHVYFQYSKKASSLRNIPSPFADICLSCWWLFDPYHSASSGIFIFDVKEEIPDMTNSMWHKRWPSQGLFAKEGFFCGTIVKYSRGLYAGIGLKIRGLFGTALHCKKHAFSHTFLFTECFAHVIEGPPGPFRTR
jgi:hypothetical protein